MDALQLRGCHKFQSLKSLKFQRIHDWIHQFLVKELQKSLIHTVTAACRSLPYCDEAAKEAKAKLFSMWYSFGPPSIFLPFLLVMNAASGLSFS